MTEATTHKGLHRLPAQHSALEPHCVSGVPQLGVGGAGAEWLPKESQVRGGLESSERGAAAAASSRPAAARSRMALLRCIAGG